MGIYSTIRFYKDWEWHEIFPDKFFVSSYENKKLDLDHLWKIFSEDIKDIENSSLMHYIENDNLDIPKLPHLFRSFSKEGMLSPIFFYNNQQRGGLGRGLVASVYYPDMDIKVVNQLNELGDIEQVHNIVKKLDNKKNKPVASVIVKEGDCKGYYMKQIEFDDETQKGYLFKGTFLNNIEDTYSKTYFWNLIHSRDIDHTRRGLKKLLDEIVEIEL